VALLANITMAEDAWRFISLPDWHSAEKYVTKWETGTVENKSGWGDKGYASYDDYRAAMVAADSNKLADVNACFGGELIVMPGDTQSGHWDTTAFQNTFKSIPEYSGYSSSDVIVEAGHLVYSGLKEGFAGGGYTNLLIAVGDHEIGDNPWPVGNTVSTQLPAFREGFADVFNRETIGGAYIHTDPIGAAPARPYGTPYEATSYAVQYRNVLFITADVFYQQDPGVTIGPEGTVKGELVGDHLAWFTNVLAQANGIPSIDHIIVQSHLPGIYPVRKYASSGMLLTNNENSDFFAAMRQYGVDIYMGGEVHGNTVTLDPTSDLVQLVTRGNGASNPTVFDVYDDRMYIETYKGQTNTTRLGTLEIDKSGGGAVVTGAGVLKPIDPQGLQYHFAFDETIDEDDIVTSANNSRKVNTLCDRAFENDGGFGVDYTAFAKNCSIDPGGIIGGAAIIGASSEIGITSMGPIMGGFERTVACWVKTTSAERQIIFDTSSAWGTPQFFNLSLDNGLLEVILKNGQVKGVNSPAVNDGTWHHVAAVVPTKSCTLSDVRLYVDGERRTDVTTQAGGTTVDTTQANWPTIGIMWSQSRTDLNAQFGMVDFSGSLDEFCLWTRALSDADIRALYGGATSRSYDGVDMEALFKLYDSATGSVDVAGTSWTYDPTLTGNEGEFVWDGTTNTLVLGGSGGVMSTGVPLPTAVLGPNGLVVAWHTPDATAQNAGANDSTPDFAIEGVTASLSGGRDGWASFNSTDGSYGSLSVPAVPGGAANAIRVRTHSVAQSRLDLALTNNSGTPLVLESLHFDFGGFNDGPLDVSLSYLSGDLGNTNNTPIAATNRMTGSSAVADYEDFDIPLSPALPDVVLRSGESMTLRLSFGNAAMSNTASGVDNIALTASVELGTTLVVR